MRSNNNSSKGKGRLLHSIASILKPRRHHRSRSGINSITRNVSIPTSDGSNLISSTNRLDDTKNAPPSSLEAQSSSGEFIFTDSDKREATRIAGQNLSHFAISSSPYESIQLQVLSDVEGVLRLIVLLVGSFLLGVHCSHDFLYLQYVQQAGISCSIAWCTCLLLKWMTVSATKQYTKLHPLEQLQEYSHNLPSHSQISRIDSLQHDLLDDSLRSLTTQEKEASTSIVKSTSTSGSLKNIRGIGQGQERQASQESLVNNDTATPKKSGSTHKNVKNTMELYNSTSSPKTVHLSSPTPHQLSSTNHEIDTETIPAHLMTSTHENRSVLQQQDHHQQPLQQHALKGLEEPQPHPELELFRAIDSANSQRIRVNDSPYSLDNEYFSGVFFPMIRTSDADLPEPPKVTDGTPQNDKISNYFRPKKRRFEMQLQIKFKKPISSHIYIGLQTDEANHYSFIQRAFINSTIKFISKRTSLHHSLGTTDVDDELRKSGQYEKPIFSFPMFLAMDAVAQTPPGETPPTLGEDIYEDPIAKKQRKKDNAKAPQIVNTTDTYTMTIYSTYIDFIKWQIVNLPAVKPFSVSTFMGDQHLNVVLYMCDARDGKHYVSDMKILGKWEFSHKYKSPPGPATLKYLQGLESKQIGDIVTMAQHPVLDTPRSLSDDSSVNDADVFMSLNDDIEDASSDDEEFVAEQNDGENNSNDTSTLEDLGDGIYLKSGDPVVICESSSSSDAVSFLADGGGQAILQCHSKALIIIEKVSRVSRNRKRIIRNLGQSKFIRNGDMVTIKLVENQSDSKTQSYKYLVSQRHARVKWISSAVKSSSVFTFVSDQRDEQSVDENGFIRLEAPFHLRSYRSGYLLGVRTNSSTTYGGRMIEIYRKGDHNLEASKQLMKPLLLTADLPICTDDPRNSLSPLRQSSLSYDSTASSPYPYRLDAPAWIQMMHRRNRALQLVYVVRARNPTKSEETVVDDESPCFTRFRTGKDLTPLLKLGSTLNRSRSKSDGWDRKIDNQVNSTNQESHFKFDREYDLDSVSSAESLYKDNDQMGDQDHDSEDEYFVDEGIEDNVDIDSLSDEDKYNEMKSPKEFGADKRKSWKKIAKGVKAGTAITGKTVIKSGKMVGSLVSTGMRSTNKRNSSTIRRGKDHHIAVNKTLKTINCEDADFLSNVVAGELSAPDQSCRVVSHILRELSSDDVKGDGASFAARNHALSKFINLTSDLDNWFLTGGPIELGVSPSKLEGSNLVAEYVVARCLWESHWQEEACLLYDNCVAFYEPLARKPCFVIQFLDIRNIRDLDLNDMEMNPLQGFPTLAIETPWKCHYLTFSGERKRSDFHLKLNAAIFSEPETERMAKKDSLWKAHECQGFQTSVKPTVAYKSKWANITSAKKSYQRLVLNSRRMSYDIMQFGDNDESYEASVGKFVQSLLQSALSFSSEDLESSASNLMTFLDETSRLKAVSLQRLDFSSKAVFCIFVNLYHCLLQHSLLLSLKGPPTKRTVSAFMRTHCYEIGGDVFSLAELECCVLRGNMSNALHPRPPFVIPPRKSIRPYRSMYALGTVDPKINFVLNTGDKTRPPVSILHPINLEQQLINISTTFLNDQLVHDVSKKVIILPKICDVYRNDFGKGSTLSCIHYCLQFLNLQTQQDILEMLNESPSPIFKYQHSCDQFNSFLKS